MPRGLQTGRSLACRSCPPPPDLRKRAFVSLQACALAFARLCWVSCTCTRSIKRALVAVLAVFHQNKGLEKSRTTHRSWNQFTLASCDDFVLITAFGREEQSEEGIHYARAYVTILVVHLNIKLAVRPGEIGGTRGSDARNCRVWHPLRRAAVCGSHGGDKSW